MVIEPDDRAGRGHLLLDGWIPEDGRMYLAVDNSRKTVTPRI